MMAWTLAMGHSMIRAGLALGAPVIDNHGPDVVHAHDWLVAHPAITLAEFFDVHWFPPSTPPRRAVIRAGSRVRSAARCTPWNRGSVHESDSLITCSSIDER